MAKLMLKSTHRLMCGNSTDAGDLERLLRGEKAALFYCDPPYGVNERTMRLTAGRGKLAKDHDFRPVIGDDSTQTAIQAYRLAETRAPLQVWWGANYYAHALPEVSSWLVWDKRAGVDSDDNADCELAWSNTRKPARLFSHLWRGCIRASEKTESKVHPTQKPVALHEWAFATLKLEPGAVVVDLFGGSGSTLVACEKTHTRGFLCEIDPHYCDVIVERYRKFCGKLAIKTEENQASLS